MTRMTAKPNSWWGSSYVLHEAPRKSRRAVARVDLGRIMVAAQLDVRGKRYSVRRNGFWRARYQLRDDTRVVGRAEQVGAWSSRLEVRFGRRKLELVPSSMWRSSFDVREGRRTVGRIKSSAWFRRDVEIDVPSDLAPHEQAFLFALVGLVWRSNSAGAAAASA